MNNILAAEVLRSHLDEISDGAYKTATEIAIEVLYMDALNDWHRANTDLTAREYLRLNFKEYNRWIAGKEPNLSKPPFPNPPEPILIKETLLGKKVITNN